MLGIAGLGVPNLAALGTGAPAIPAQNVDVGVPNNTQSFFAPVLALEAAQNIGPVLFDEGDLFYPPSVTQDALPDQILVQYFVEVNQFYAPAIALEAAQAINVAYFDEGDLFYTPQIFGVATDLTINIGLVVNGNEFYGPQFVVAGKEPVYTYPIGRGMYSDYGIRASITNYKRRMIIGNRR
jgi:hypothetical protein